MSSVGGVRTESWPCHKSPAGGQARAGLSPHWAVGLVSLSAVLSTATVRTKRSELDPSVLIDEEDRKQVRKEGSPVADIPRPACSQSVSARCSVRMCVGW